MLVTLIHSYLSTQTTLSHPALSPDPTTPQANTSPTDTQGPCKTMKSLQGRIELTQATRTTIERAKTTLLSPCTARFMDFRRDAAIDSLIECVQQGQGHQEIMEIALGLLFKPGQSDRGVDLWEAFYKQK